MNQEYNGLQVSWRYLLLLNLCLLALLILATRLATCLHEFIGHAFTAKALGGHVNAIWVSLFGGGKVHYDLSAEPGSFARFLVAFGGIIINILSGILPFIFLRRINNKAPLSLFLSLFSMVSLLGAIAYSALGFYYQQGDPVAWRHKSSTDGGLLWIPFLLVSPFVSFYTVRLYVNVSGKLLPASGFLRRLIMTFVTLGVVMCIYAGLFGITQQRSMALETPRLAYKAAENKIRKQRIHALVKQLRDAHPEWTAEEIQKVVKRTPIVIKPQEVPTKFPLKPVLAVLFAIGGLWALWKTIEVPKAKNLRIDVRSVVLSTLLAAAVIAILAWTGGWLWHANIG